ncbi:MAG: hypothetical protein OXE49_01445 [Gemmatimonadetes bacterium]|nr:hypothetical protein [Gemmatimonadota bacterium]
MKFDKRVVNEARALVLGAPLCDLKKFAQKHGHTAAQVVNVAEGRAPEHRPPSALLSLDPEQIALARHSISRGEIPDGLDEDIGRAERSQWRVPTV